MRVWGFDFSFLISLIRTVYGSAWFGSVSGGILGGILGGIARAGFPTEGVCSLGPP